MNTIFNIDFSRTITAAIGTLLLTTAFVGAAVAPARAVETDGTIRIAQVEAAGELRG